MNLNNLTEEQATTIGILIGEKLYETIKDVSEVVSEIEENNNKKVKLGTPKPFTFNDLIGEMQQEVAENPEIGEANLLQSKVDGYDLYQLGFSPGLGFINCKSVYEVF